LVQHHQLYSGVGADIVMESIRRHQIARVSLNEKVARPSLRKKVGHNSGIGAGDEHRHRLLPAFQRLKHLALSGIDLGLKFLYTLYNSYQRFLTLHASSIIEN
ncbi:MAG: hypothetical protein WBQ76_10985, partial [Candidatus Korobacteraceae bacterium]